MYGASCPWASWPRGELSCGELSWGVMSWGKVSMNRILLPYVVCSIEINIFNLTLTAIFKTDLERV